MVNSQLHEKYITLWNNRSENKEQNGQDNTIDSQLIQVLNIVDDLKNGSSPLLGGTEKDINYRNLQFESTIPNVGQSLEKIMHRFEGLAQGHPIQSEFYMTNAIPPPTDISLAGALFALALQSNPVFDVYGPAAVEAEITAVSMMSELAGFEKMKASGYFTYGGTGGNDAALRIGIQKAAPGSMQKGIPQNLYIIANDIKHFSVDSVVADSGIGMDKILNIASNSDNSMNLEIFEDSLRNVFTDGGDIAAIYATVGTTDGFGLDDVHAIRNIRNRLVKEFKKDYVPHIHADLANGGFYLFFNNYDFDENPCDFNMDTLNGLQTIREKMLEIRYADSFIMDFHKMGYTPYLNSIFVVKNAKDLKLVDRDAGLSPYIGDRGYSEFHTGYTKECSRFPASIPAMVNLRAFGAEGYQVILGNAVERALQFKDELSKMPDVAVLNTENPGPVVNFRLYQTANDMITERSFSTDQDKTQKNNEYMDGLMNYFGENRHKIFFGDTKRYRNAICSNGETEPIYAMKAFMISPFTTEQTVKETVDYVRTMKDQYDAKIAREQIKEIVV